MSTNFKYELTQQTNEMPSQMPGGIHSDVELASIRFEDLTPNNPIKVLRFTFRKDGMQFKYTELPVNEEAIARWNFRKSTFEETVGRKYREVGERLKHIYMAITNETRVKLESNTWDEFCEEYVLLTKDKYQGKKFGIKVVYNEKGYPTFPDRAIQPFIVAADQVAKLKVDPQHDRIFPPEPQEERVEVSEEYYPTGVTGPSQEGCDEELTF